MRRVHSTLKTSQEPFQFLAGTRNNYISYAYFLSFIMPQIISLEIYLYGVYYYFEVRSMSACCHKKHQPRSEQEIKQLSNRLHRMVGQLNGIENMLKENRYCGDILVQVAAVESALQAFGYIVLQEHLNTCVVEDVQNGNAEIMSEVMDLVKKLK